jgi:fructosamine-3-kinase
MHLKDLLGDPAQREKVVSDCVDLIDAEVKSKSGLSGMAIKAGYAVINGMKPTFVREAVDHMLDEFATKLDAIYQEAKTANKPIASYFDNNAPRVADALLEITDARAKRAKTPAVAKTYERLRGDAKKNVEAAVPRLGALVAKYDR